MQKKQNFIPFFLVFLTLSLFLIFLGNSGIINSITSVFNSSTSGIRTSSIGVLAFGNYKNRQINELLAENIAYKKALAAQQNLVIENKALKDQFALSQDDSLNILPAQVVGLPGFIPGVSTPEYLIINKGEKDGVKMGSAVMINNYLIGKVIKLTDSSSKVNLLTNKNSVYTAVIKPNDGAEIIGVLRGKGNNEMVLDNVLLTADMKKNTLVYTKGEKDENNNGIPPGLIVGRVVSIEKKPADLFQKAAIKTPVDFKSLETVFILP